MHTTGYLLTNLGTPQSPTTKDVRPYLNEFLMDPYVLDIPWPIRRMIVSAFILPFRPKQSAEAYASIWTEQGSPLLLYSEALKKALADTLAAPVALGMRYGQPSIAAALDELVQQNVEHVIVAPLYPQHADSTVTTTMELVENTLPAGMSHTFVAPFYDDQRYIDALTASVRASLPDEFDHLLMSYHGLPERHMTKADPTGAHCLQSPDCCEVASPAHATCYRHQVYATSRALAAQLGLQEEQYSVSFQSRLGRIPWLQPYTDQVLAELPARGVKRVAVTCPAFVADNLETLEEMGIQGSEIFRQAGGESFHLIPCLNDDEGWVAALADILTGYANSAASSESSV